MALGVHFNGVRLDIAYKVDMLVEDLVIVELKSVERLIPVHEAQLLSYLKLSKRPVGLLINFNVMHLRDGICRKVL
jgi:GxxExxY protein